MTLLICRPRCAMKFHGEIESERENIQQQSKTIEKYLPIKLKKPRKESFFAV